MSARPPLAPHVVPPERPAASPAEPPRIEPPRARPQITPPAVVAPPAAAAPPPPPPAPAPPPTIVAPSQARAEPERKTARFMGVAKGKVIVDEPARPVEIPAPPPPPPEPPLPVTAPVPPARLDPPTRRPSYSRAEPEAGALVDQAVRELKGEIDLAESAPDGKVEVDPWWRGDRLARGLGVDERVVCEALGALATRGRVLLQGPAWTGKTHLARRLALHVAAREERVVLLRVHPELGYDELVEARASGEGPPRPGVVKELLERARRERDERFVLVLDEVDRGDLGRALGELLSSFAERGAEVTLARSRERTSIPRNLFAIATSREPPRGALEGKLPVVEVAPDPEALRSFFATRRPSMEWTADLLRDANARLAASARFGHGVLMDPELDGARLEAIWRREVLPLVAARGGDPRTVDLASLTKKH